MVYCFLSFPFSQLLYWLFKPMLVRVEVIFSWITILPCTFYVVFPSHRKQFDLEYHGKWRNSKWQMRICMLTARVCHSKVKCYETSPTTRSMFIYIENSANFSMGTYTWCGENNTVALACHCESYVWTEKPSIVLLLYWFLLTVLSYYKHVFWSYILPTTLPLPARKHVQVFFPFFCKPVNIL